MGSLEASGKWIGKVTAKVKPFVFPIGANGPGVILCLGAHSDDIEIGCGGTILFLTHRNPDLTVHWVVLSAPGERGREASVGAERFLKKAKTRNVVLKEFKDGYFPYAGSEIKELFEELKKTVTPDLIFTHYRKDRHQDHRLVSDLTWNTFRDQAILEYEIPKYDGDLGIPNCFVPLSEQIVREKIDVLTSVFGTQRGKHWFDEELFRSLLRIRGVESAARHAEAFHVRKLVLG